MAFREPLTGFCSACGAVFWGRRGAHLPPPRLPEHEKRRRSSDLRRRCKQFPITLRKVTSQCAS